MSPRDPADEALLQAYRAQIRRAVRRARWRWFVGRLLPAPWRPGDLFVPLPCAGFDRWLCHRCTGLPAPAVVVGVRPDQRREPLCYGLCADHAAG